ncbi:MAG: TonB-dependent receptor [Pyrinomonadaceae bacterium]|nr:TonB-dependent receptor [Pyrinomonadaceae bacterium]
MFSRRIVSWGFATFLFVLLSSAAFAQTTGIITGIVTESSGAVIPGARVIVRNTGTDEERAVETNSDGAYVAYSLPIGQYEISVTATGFKTTVRTGINLSVADRLGINLVLDVGGVAETVTVTGEAPVVDTEKGDLSYTVNTRQITDLAVNGRTFTSLQQLMPGASRMTGDEGGVGFNSNKGFAINGQRADYSGLLVDGVENTDMGSQSVMFTSPGMETVGEFKVQTSNYSAEYGTAGGANILVVTRSGTKEFHGAVYEYLRNDKLDARNFFAASKPTLRYNNFGYRIGGPITIPRLYNQDRDKTFFFFAQEWRRRRTQRIFRAATPTLQMRAGDFSAEAARTGTPIIDPDTGQPFPGNRIPTARLNRNALLLLENVFPQPNTTGFLNIQENAGEKEDWRQEALNLTHQLTGGTQLMVRYIQDTWVQDLPGVLWGGHSFSNISSTLDVPGKSFLAKVTSAVNPTLLHEFSFAHGSNYGPEEKRAVRLRGAFEEPAGLNIPRLFPRVAGRPNKIPNLSFSQGWGNVDTSYYPWWAHHNISTLTDIVSKAVGPHSLKFGGTFQFSKTPVESQVNPADQGGFSFSGSFTNHPIADFLLGRANSYSELDKLLAPSYDYPQLELFVQDTWKATPRLTLNLGVRYFYIPHLHEANDLISTFRTDRYDPAKAVTVLPNGNILPGSGDPLNGIIGVKDGLSRGLVQNHPWTFGPRLGFAYDPTGAGKWAIRGGYGVGYYRVEGNDTYRMVSNPPGARLVTVFNPLLDNPSAGQIGALRPISINSLDPVYEVPMTQTYSLEVQRELVPGTAVSLAYVGTRGTHLDRARNINQPLPTGGFDFDTRLNTRTIPAELIRPYQGFTNISQIETTASSTYHSMQFTFKRRLARGLLFDTSYTWSRAITDASDFGENPQNSYNLRAERALANFDRTHMLIFNYIYELPFLRDQSKLTGKLFGGWQISGVTQFQSGTPRNVGLTGGTIGLANRPNVKTGVSSKGPETIAQWFNTAAFEAPPFGFFGNAGRNLIRGPGIHNWDFSLFKSFAIREQAKVQLRAEWFNFFNHPNFDGVSTSFGSGNFGQVTSARSARVTQLALKIEF